MLLYVYLFTQIFLQAAAAFEPISLDFKRVGDVRNVKRVEESGRFNRGNIEARGIVNVDTMGSITEADLVKLMIGSENEVVELLLDFSTSDLVVLSSDADADADSYWYWDTRFFNQSESTSFKQNETIYSETGYIRNGSGFWGQDDVTIGNTTIEGLDFAVLNVSTMWNGVLGLGMPEWESTYENASDPHIYENFPMKLKSQGLISKVAYSVYHNPGSFYESDDGNLLFGAVDHAKYSGNLTTLPMIKYNSTGVTVSSEWTGDNFVEERHFQVLFHGMKFSNGTENNDEIITISNNTYYAAIYPLYGVSFFPQKIVDAMGTALEGLKSLEDDQIKWNIPCVEDDSIVFLFDFGGITLRVPATSLSEWTLSGCLLNAIATPGDEDFILLGRGVMQNAYSVYDLEDREISIAQVEVSDMNDIEEIVSLVPGAIKGSTQTTIGSSATQSTDSSSTKGNSQSSTDGTTTEPKESLLSTSKTLTSSDAPSQQNSSTSKAVSLTWLMVSCLFASVLVLI